MAASKILWVGDSLTTGTAPIVKQKRSNIEWYGVVGRNAKNTLEALKATLNSSHTVVVFDAGTNDDPHQPETYEATLKSVVKAVGSRPLVLATINRGGYSTSEMNKRVYQVANAHAGQVTVVKWEEKVTAEPSLLSGDGTHPTPHGYNIRADMFDRVILDVAGTAPGGKTSTKVKASKVRSNATFWKQKKKFLAWERWGLRPNMTIDDFKLSWVGSAGRDLRVTGAITELRITRSIEGASEINMTIEDPHGHFFDVQAGRSLTRPVTTKLKNTNALKDDAGKPLDAPTLSGRAVEVTLDDVVFRLSKVTGDISNRITLTFEDRMIYWLRRKKGALSASRASVTRAEFILKMVREVKTETIPFICPQLKKKQPQAKPKVDESEDAASLSSVLRSTLATVPGPSDSGTNPNFNPRTTSKHTDKKSPNEDKGKGIMNAKGLTVKGEPATHDQKKNINELLNAAWEEKGMTRRAAQSAVCTVITEKDANNTEGGLGGADGMFQVEPTTANSYGGIDPLDIAQCTHIYMTKGFTGAGGAIEVCKKHPDWPIYRICQFIQGSGAGRATNGQANYGPNVAEAGRWVDAWSGKETSVGGEQGGQYRKSYQYHRDKDENSWDAAKRLADEVQWRVFPVGRAMFYLPEDELFRRVPAEQLDKEDPRILEFNWDMDWNKTTNECSLTVVLKEWSAYPGTTIVVDGFGPPDGRWLVTELERDWYGESGTLTIKQPMTPKKEPAAEVGKLEQGVSGEGTGGDIGKLYKACKHISDGTPGYVWGGQHGVPLSQMSGQKGLDCSSSCSLALYRADLWDDETVARVSGPAVGKPNFSNWGSPGAGHLFTVYYNNQHVWIHFEEAAGMMYKRFDTSGQGEGRSGDGPKMRRTERSHDGFQARHWKGM